MNRSIPKGEVDFYSGALLVGIAGVALWFISGLEIGTPGRMKTGFFPFAIAIILGLMGLFLVIRGLLVQGPKVETIFLRPLAMVLLSAAAFAVFVDRLGLIVAILAQVTVASFAPSKVSLAESLFVGVVLAAVSAVVFIWLLGVPMKTFPW